MIRILNGACFGALFGVAALTAIGAWAGFTYGGEAVGPPSREPGPSAALVGAFVYTAYFWWLGGGLGCLIGGLAGLGSALVRAANPSVPNESPDGPPPSATTDRLGAKKSSCDPVPSPTAPPPQQPLGQ